jgi:hypothetical protein
VSCHRTYGRTRGRASTASGTSQITYCGDHTLFRMRNVASSRKQSCGSRGRRGAASASTAMSTQATAKAPEEIRFSSLSEEFPITGRL